jgi:PAT family beta-lactamase induction signal transducer AmpG
LHGYSRPFVGKIPVVNPNPPTNRRPAWWVPSLYFAEGLPYAVVTGMLGTALPDLGFSASETAEYTSLLMLPWAFKPFWAPVIERMGTRRSWIWTMQAAGAAVMILLAIFLPDPSHLALALSLLAGVGVISATHDMAADGFYIEALDEKRQAGWSGIRNTFYRVASLAGNGGLVWLGGKYEIAHGAQAGWSLAFLFVALTMGVLAVYHFGVLPRLAVSEKPAPANTPHPLAKNFSQVWRAFVEKPGFWRIFLFILFYRFAEGQVQSCNKTFFLATLAKGGLGMGADAVGLYYGTWGVLALMAGGILGGLVIARFGLRRWLWPMAAAMNIPNVLYIWLAWAQPQNRMLLGGVIGLEQFGYGFGFAAFMVYLLYVARGEHATAHYAICTGLMAVGMALAGQVASLVLAHTEKLSGGGYTQFFSWVMLCALVSFATLWKLPMEGE